MNYTIEYVRYLLESKGIERISELSIFEIAECFGFHLFETAKKSKIIPVDDDVLIFINFSKGEFAAREDFFHELAHYLLDHNFHQNIGELYYAEGKANRLAYYLSIPSNEIYEMDYKSETIVAELSEKFSVSLTYALQRYLMFCENSEYSTKNSQKYYRNLINIYWNNAQA